METDLQTRFNIALEETGVKPPDQEALWAYISLLLKKGPITRMHGEHCIRVALTAKAIAEFTHHDPRALVFAGSTHDTGKCQVNDEVLGKTKGWTKADAKIIQRHVMDGYRMLRGRFDFSAETILLHHRFQENGYPKVLPPHLHEYSEQTKLLIAEHGRLLAIADVYDALHRENDKFGETRRLSDKEIREQMFILNPDRERLVEALYKAGVLA